MTILATCIGTLASLFLLSGPGIAHARRDADCDAARSAIRTQIEAACPCADAANHAEHVRCVTAKLRELSACSPGEGGKQECGPVPRQCVGKIRRFATRSACGDTDAVTCCFPKQYDCVNDSAPGDGNRQGTCAESNRPCDRVTDCTLSKCRIAKSAERCRLEGGTAGSGKDCSTACAN